MTKFCALILATLPLAALAHEGHGEPGASHWHATDAMGFALALAIGAGLIWWNRRK